MEFGKVNNKLINTYKMSKKESTPLYEEENFDNCYYGCSCDNDCCDENCYYDNNCNDCGCNDCCDYEEDFEEDLDYQNAEIGELAPDFYLDGYFKGEIQQYSLSQFEGKWTVLFFYPLDFTFVCPTELLELSKRHKEFEKINTQILGISVDSVYAHKAWSKELGDLNFPLISDFNKDTSFEYNVLHNDGMSLRGTFIIDPEGIVRSYTVNDLNIGRNIDEIIRTIQALETGELCQVGWKPGEKTLGKAE